MLKGIFFSILASVTFGVLFFYSQYLKPLDGEQVFAWRIVATLPFLTAGIYYLGDLNLIKNILIKVRNQPRFILLLLLSSLLGCSQLWLFLWGPMHGYGLEVSLGYFLLPLMLVLSGYFFYREKLSNFQKVAVMCAGFGVGYAFFSHGMIAWQTFMVAFGYSAYFLLRKKMQTDHLGGFWWDLFLCLPVCIYFILDNDINIHIYQSHLLPVIVGLGVLSAFGLGSYLLASRYLPMGLFGLLSYLEPILLAVVSLLLGEKIPTDEWVTYLAIWFAIFLLIIEGILHIVKAKVKH